MIVVQEAGSERDPHAALRPGPQMILHLLAVSRRVAGVVAVQRGRDPVLDQPGGMVERVQVGVERRNPEHLDHPALERLVGTTQLHRADAAAVLVRAREARQDEAVVPADFPDRRMSPPQLRGTAHRGYDRALYDQAAVWDFRKVQPSG